MQLQGQIYKCMSPNVTPQLKINPRNNVATQHDLLCHLTTLTHPSQPKLRKRIYTLPSLHQITIFSQQFKTHNKIWVTDL